MAFIIYLERRGGTPWYFHPSGWSGGMKHAYRFPNYEAARIRAEEELKTVKWAKRLMIMDTKRMLHWEVTQ